MRSASERCTIVVCRRIQHRVVAGMGGIDRASTKLTSTVVSIEIDGAVRETRKKVAESRSARERGTGRVDQGERTKGSLLQSRQSHNADGESKRRRD
ncbi:hypothetical protein THAOC_17054 [Thalassiosira oceanica]|uniref:Uncharacterized protein n=1 Tax=Thalassiosira oceanica TaxID=159749 RepID=K0SBM0_THAOC|nr:hypothetical protein THAOC_17054 [Thalassiosira oceanica]|eukprot:EJK62339.1 hypothetical protein THAOC_17054 [Thalassiosira oceanica]